MTAPRYLTRDELDLFQPNTHRLSTRTDLVTGITFHRTGERVKPSQTRDVWKGIQQSAMNGTLPSGDRYGDHPYNVGVPVDGPDAGNVYIGRDTRWNGAHAASTKNVANRVTLGVAVIGDGELTPKARDAIRGVVWVAALTYRRGLFLYDHLDWKALGGIATSCPGDDVADFVLDLRAHFRK